MNETDKIVFEILKKEVAQTFLKENTALSPAISQWKGEDIIKFQEDLLLKVKGRVSEKWFYNYFRNDIQKLPRIDMLNLLSEYVGAKDWATFRAKQLQQEHKKQNTKKYSEKLMRYGVWLLVALFIIGVLSFVINQNSAHHVSFCFTDESGNRIEDVVNVQLQLDNETEKTVHISQDSCFHILIANPELTIKIKSPYYKDKLITRKLNQTDYQETIMLETDLNALILRHYSNSDTSNWQKRRKRLNALIADDAILYQQWFGVDRGVELYSKSDFVYQMTIPTSILKHIEILAVSYNTVGKIKQLRFRVNK